MHEVKRPANSQGYENVELNGRKIQRSYATGAQSNFFTRVSYMD